MSNAGSGSGKTNVLPNLIKHQQPDIAKIVVYVKDPFKSKYQLLINKREKVGIKKLKNPRPFIDYSQTIDDVYKNLEKYNSTKKREVLVVIDDMIADMEANKKLSPTVTKFFLRVKKVNTSLVLISQMYFIMPETIRLNATHYFIMKIPNKREL